MSPKSDSGASSSFSSVYQKAPLQKRIVQPVYPPIKVAKYVDSTLPIQRIKPSASSDSIESSILVDSSGDSNASLNISESSDDDALTELDARSEKSDQSKNSVKSEKSESHSWEMPWRDNLSDFEAPGTP